MKNRFGSRKVSRTLTALLLVAGLATGAAAQEEYLIGGGDVLDVNVWKNTELTRTVTVRPDGRVTLPLIRDVMAGGLTAAELAVIVAERFSAFVNAPNVTVTVAAANSYRVYTQGALAAGMHVLEAPTTARQLLARSGAVDPAADLAEAYVLRGEARVPVDLSASPVDGRAGIVDQPLLAGDVLVVPRREARTDRVLVAGEVAAPQRMTFEAGMTVLDAFLGAGGATAAADLKGVRISREAGASAPGELSVDLEQLLEQGDLARNVRLAPGDVIVVPRRPETGRVLIAGEVRTPLSLPYREGMTVLDAFVEAGGGTEYADLDSTKVVRQGGDGKREEIPVDLDRALRKGEIGRNIALLPGDVVVVPR